MAKRSISYVFVSILSLSCLSVSFEPSGSRGIACVDPIAEANFLPLSGNLFGEIQDEALRKSTLDYYLFLSKVEMQALAGRQAIFSSYGVISNGSNLMIPQVQNFDLQGNSFANGSLWGQFNGDPLKNSLSVGKNLPQLSIPPYSSALASAGVASGPFGGIGGGIALPSSNAPSHKIGM